MSTYFLTAYALDAVTGRLTTEVDSLETGSLTSALRTSDEWDARGLYVSVQYQSHDRGFVRSESLAWLRNEEG
ncbi:MAG: hypothetical protein JWN04_4213 [Myxococcaceae bacterium]|nr:hypothetical protein [Myxococcaceae bacterium]